MSHSNKPNWARYRYVLQARDGGATFTSIAKELGVSVTRIIKIYHKGHRMLRSPSERENIFSSTQSK